MLLGAIEGLGPTFVKLGQWMSTRPDIFPVDLTELFRKLHDNVSPQPFDVVRAIVDSEIGLDKFQWIDMDPIGSGCIAQVHKALLDNRFVAIKVRRPAIVSVVEQDLAILRVAAGIINLFPNMEWLSLPEEVEQFSELMRLQMDMRIEARNLEEFGGNFETNSQIRFPRVNRHLTTEKILVEEYVPGVSIGFLLDSHNSIIRQSVAEIGVKAFLKMMIVDNFIHSDLHPGNIIVQFVDDNDDICEYHDGISLKDYHTKLVFIDAGLVTRLSKLNQDNFLDLFCALANGDGLRVAELMVERSRQSHPESEKCIDYPGFCVKMRRLIAAVQRQTFQLSNIKIGELLQKVFSLVREHHVKIESDFTNLVVSMIVIEGLGRQLDPELDLFEAARPFLRFRNKDFYLQHEAVFLKLSAFLETRYWLKARHTKDYAIVDCLIFNNY